MNNLFKLVSTELDYPEGLEELEALKEWGDTVEGFLVYVNEGRWNGRFAGWYMDKDWESIFCAMAGVLDDFEIYHAGDHLEVAGYHHDGDNCYKVYPLTLDGMWLLADENADEISFASKIEWMSYSYEDDEPEREKKSLIENLKDAIDHDTVLRMPFGDYAFK